MTRVSERGERAPGPALPAPGARGPFGTPSAGLSLVGLRPRRARLRFTRPDGCTRKHGLHTRASRQGKQRRCRGHEDPTGCSEGSPVFGLDNGVHYSCWQVASWSTKSPRAAGVLTSTLSTPGVFLPALTCVTLLTLMRMLDRLRSMSFLSERTRRWSFARAARQIRCLKLVTLRLALRQAAESQTVRPLGPLASRRLCI